MHTSYLQQLVFAVANSSRDRENYAGRCLRYAGALARLGIYVRRSAGTKYLVT